MSSIETVDVKTDEAPINNELVENNESVNEEPKVEKQKEEQLPEEPREMTQKQEPKPKAKATIKPRVSVEMIECEDCGKHMRLKNYRYGHKKVCRGAPTELTEVKPKQVRKIQPEVKEEIKNEIKQEVIKETIKTPTATELLNQHYEELKQKKKQDKQEKINTLSSSMF